MDTKHEFEMQEYADQKERTLALRAELTRLVAGYVFEDIEFAFQEVRHDFVKSRLIGRNKRRVRK